MVNEYEEYINEEGLIETYDSQDVWEPECNESLAKKLLFFLVWPFGAWIYALKSANTKTSHLVFFLFSLLICWHMAPVNLSGMYDDFIGILARFQEDYYTFEDVVFQSKLYFSFAADAPKELYEIYMTHITKSLSDNYHLYFLLCGIPVAILQLACLKHITGDYRYQINNFICIITIALFVFPRDIITVQNPRYATAFWLSMICVISYYSGERKSIWRLLPILFSPLIHSGMWMFAIAALVFVLIPNKIMILQMAAICSIPFSFFDSNILSGFDLSSVLPASLYKWSLNHFDPSSNITRDVAQSGFWWVGSTFTFFRKATFIYLLIIFVKYKERIMAHNEMQHFFPFFLFITTLINLLQPVPVLGERYYWFIQALSVYVWFKAFYPDRAQDIFLLLSATSWAIFQRYGYYAGGALSCNTDPDLFFTPLPYLIGRGLFW